jgi:hypothetical protein
MGGPSNASVTGLRGGHECAACDDFAARDLRSARNRRVEMLVIDPFGDELR